MFRRTRVLVGLLGLVAAIILPAAGAGAATTYEVQVGAPLFALPAANGAPADGMRFYAPPLRVHQGDVITYGMAGFHTATMLPANTDGDTWVAANAAGLGKPYSFATADPDEGAAGAKFNSTAILPSALDCGDATAPCAYDGSAVVNSGIVDANDVNGQEYRFSVQINSPVGSTTTVLCLIHLGMRLQISVVASTENATTQAEIDDYAAQKSNHDAKAASKLHRSLLAMSFRPRGGVVQAFAGYDGPHFALDNFYPNRIELKKGQRVRWHFDSLKFEDHTVTLPAKKALTIAGNTFVPVCDPDGDLGTMPDQPADMTATTVATVCPGGASQIELDIDPRFGPPAGDGVVTSTHDFESSGIEGANVGNTTAFKLRFRAKTENKPYTFRCMIHPFMRGKVIVG
jgi:plastocyanin